MQGEKRHGTPLRERKASWQKWLSLGLKLLCPIISCTRAAAFSMPACPWGWKELSQKARQHLPAGTLPTYWQKFRHTLKLTWSICGYQTGASGESLSLYFRRVPGGKTGLPGQWARVSMKLRPLPSWRVYIRSKRMLRP